MKRVQIILYLLYATMIIAVLATMTSCTVMVRKFGSDGKEIRVTNPRDGGVGTYRFDNETDQYVHVETSTVDTLVPPRQHIKFLVPAGDSLKVDGVTIDQELKGRTQGRFRKYE